MSEQRKNGTQRDVKTVRPTREGKKEQKEIKVRAKEIIG